MEIINNLPDLHANRLADDLLETLAQKKDNLFGHPYIFHLDFLFVQHTKLQRPVKEIVC